MTTCPRCGCEVPRGTKFCTNCGAPMQTGADSTEEASSARGAASPWPVSAAPTAPAVTAGVAGPQQQIPSQMAASVEPAPLDGAPRPAAAPGNAADSSVLRGIAVAAAIIAAFLVGGTIALTVSGMGPIAAIVGTSRSAGTDGGGSMVDGSSSAGSSQEASSSDGSSQNGSSSNATNSSSSSAVDPSKALEQTLSAARGGQTGTSLSVATASIGSGGAQTGFRDVSASTTLASQGSNSYAAGNMTDGNHTTAWVEGASGSGSGSYAVFSTPVSGGSFSKVFIAAGYQKNEKIYYYNARPQQVTIIADGQVIGTARLSDSFGSANVVQLPKSISPSAVAIRIDSVYAGSKYEDCAISEVAWL